MFIRDKKTRNPKTGKTYEKHVLVEAYWVDGKPKQRTIMQLGLLSLDRHEWPKLAHALECLLSGQEAMLSEVDLDIWELARKLHSAHEFSKGIRGKRVVETPQGDKQTLYIDGASAEISDTRTIGAETLCEWAWVKLAFGPMLKALGFTDREIAAARMLIFCKLISPGSEKHAYEWFKEHSALSEFAGSSIKNAGKDLYYDTGDILFGNKERIERHLYKLERQLYPDEGCTIFLYDLTNTYMEGSCLGNELTKRGHSKEKRTDCPLITLSLVVDSHGMPIMSHIYKGNQSEPETMPEMIERIEHTLWDDQIPMVKPTFAMDRGIATRDNVKYLTDNGFPYVVIQREDESEDYRKIYEEKQDLFVKIGQSHTSAYGEECSVFVHKLQEQDGIVKVLCISEGKARKEEAIDNKKADRFTDAIDRLNAMIKNGSVIRETAVVSKLARILEKNKTRSDMYDISWEVNEISSVGGDKTETTRVEPFQLPKVVKKTEKAETDNHTQVDKNETKSKIQEKITRKITRIIASLKSELQKPLFGCYVIETTHTELDGKEIWNLYMTLTHIEAAFRMMKSELGVRPVHHQKAGRCAAHLFLSVLAYHLLVVIKRQLEEKGDTRMWETIRTCLSTHCRHTITGKDKNGHTHHIRVTGTPELAHQLIYEKLGIKSFLSKVITQIDTLPTDNHSS